MFKVILSPSYLLLSMYNTLQLEKVVLTSMGPGRAESLNVGGLNL